VDRNLDAGASVAKAKKKSSTKKGTGGKRGVGSGISRQMDQAYQPMGWGKKMQMKKKGEKY
jgi:hypothetical protein